MPQALRGHFSNQIYAESGHVANKLAKWGRFDLDPENRLACDAVAEMIECLGEGATVSQLTEAASRAVDGLSTAQLLQVAQGVGLGKHTITTSLQALDDEVHRVVTELLGVLIAGIRVPGF